VSIDVWLLVAASENISNATFQLTCQNWENRLSLGLAKHPSCCHFKILQKAFKNKIKMLQTRVKGREPGWGRARAPSEKAPIFVLGKKWRNEEI
jgi:hypothetical protein